MALSLNVKLKHIHTVVVHIKYSKGFTNMPRGSFKVGIPFILHHSFHALPKMNHSRIWETLRSIREPKNGSRGRGRL